MGSITLTKFAHVPCEFIVKAFSDLHLKKAQCSVRLQDDVNLKPFAVPKKIEVGLRASVIAGFKSLGQHEVLKETAHQRIAPHLFWSLDSKQIGSSQQNWVLSLKIQ